MEWTDETIERLRAFWTEGLSTAEIGRRMGVTKNAIVGKAHRLLLSPRPSPIRRGGGAPVARPASPRRMVGPTLPSLAQAVAPPPPFAPSAPPGSSAETRPAPPLRPVTMPVRAPGLERRRVLACCWPIGEPGTRSFRFCDDEALAGKPYCATHAALAYVKVRDRREDAA